MKKSLHFLSLIFLLSSFNIYAQNNSDENNKFILDQFYDLLYESQENESHRAIDGLYLFMRGSDDVAKEYSKKHKNYAFFNEQKEMFSLFSETSDYEDFNLFTMGKCSGDSKQDFLLFAPMTASIGNLTNGNWSVVTRKEKSIQVFFPAKIISSKDVTVNVDGEKVTYTIYRIHFVTLEEFKKDPMLYDRY